MHKVKNLLVTLKIFDPDYTLSLTSLLMLVLIVKIAAVKDLDWMAVSALFLALCNYSAKKVIRLQASKQTAEADSKAAEIDDKLKATLDAHAAQITHVTSQVSQLLSANQVGTVMSQIMGR